MAKFDYSGLQATATALIERFGTAATVTHLGGGTSKGTIVLPSHIGTDVSTEVGTVASTAVTGFLNNVKNEVCVGDSITADSKIWRVRESTKFKGATLTSAYKVLLDN